MLAAKKTLPFAEPSLSDADKKRLEDMKKTIGRAQLITELAEIKRMEPIYRERRQILKNVQKFWPIAFLRHAGLADDLKLDGDIQVLQHLTDVWVQPNTVEPRVYTIEFTFSSNPFFKNKVLRKAYQFTESPARRNEAADRDGFKWSMLDFDWDKDVKAAPCKIDWNPGKDLCKKHPKEIDEDDGEVIELGSFFNWFESEGDAFDIGLLIADEIYPEAIQYYNGEIEDEDFDDDDDDDEDENDDDNNDNDDEEDSEDTNNNYNRRNDRGRW